MDIKVNSNTVIVFDLDDTLYNELDYLKSAFRAIAMYLDPNDWKQLYSKMFSLYRCKVNVFEFAANAYKTEIDLLIDMYRNHQPDIQLFDGVLDVFDDIKAEMGKISIVTDGRGKTQRAKLESLGILSYIDKIIISEEIGSEKPSLINFKAIESFSPGNNYWYIADNMKKDFVTPNSLGWKTAGIIDNGKNIHYDSHKFMNNEHRPQGFILSFGEINIV